jgi:pimeloyl-ACP methyl ester carboxylesterase
MSDKIYFNTSNRFSFKKSMVSLVTRTHHAIAPKHARKTARKLLLTPVRSKGKNSTPELMKVGHVNSKYGQLKTYTIGSGPLWVLNHGWSGNANQFFPLMEHIAEKGYTALAYDQPAHGESDGVFGHIPAFVNGLNAILDSVGEVQGIIAHSMGTASTLECKHAKAQNIPLLLIAPVLDYIENLFGSVDRSGYSLKLFNEVVEELQEEYRYPIHSIDPFGHLMARLSPTYIVHDRGDKFTRFDVSERASMQGEHVNLIATEGLGHGRVMKSQQVMQCFNKLASAK